MSDTKHTPGPWGFTPTGVDGDGWWIGTDEQNVARSFGYRDHPRNLADVRLLAAAPDMLAALQELVAHDERDQQHGWVSHPRLDKARAAIAKATGEPQP
jgi:hypothetical protein